LSDAGVDGFPGTARVSGGSVEVELLHDGKFGKFKSMDKLSTVYRQVTV
jgi:hypothetical protein